MEPKDIESLFHEALKRPSPAERSAYLDGACAGDAELRAEAEALLVAHEEAGGFLNAPAVQPPAESEETDKRIGPYKLLQKIGEGGMGVVYMAEQQEPVLRKVAIKVIKLGMDTKQVIARFEAERQALAMMEHPNIARVLDAGATENGRPYFVMELVRGVPITEYCDKNHLSPRERLELFIPACWAIQHAHQKGIIHRDVKPSNVLVTLHDTRPVPKIIDFGVAKATNRRLTEKTLFTEFHQFIGTPEFMSPEQAEMSGLDVDTRSDIYSLGVLLYQLLTGTTPHDAQTLREAGYGELQRIIGEVDPPSLSERVSRMGDALIEVAKHRSAEPSALAKLLAGDLDWIVMKALEKDRSRRYATALDLAADIERYLRNEPVLAHAPSAAYRVRKFVRRHRIGVLTASLLLVVILGALVATTISYRRADREATRNLAISNALENILGLADANRAENFGVDVEGVLATARKAFGEEHATVASTLNSVAVQLHQAGNLDAARPLLEEALAIWRKIYGEDHVQVASTLGRLGALLRDEGNNQEAEEALRRSLAIWSAQPDAGGLASCGTRSSLAELLQARGEFDEASEMLRSILEIRRQKAPGQRLPIIQTLEHLVAVLMPTENKAAVEEALREVYEQMNLFYPKGSRFEGMASFGLGNWLYDEGRREEAEPYLRRAVQIFVQDQNESDIYELLAVDRLFQIVRRDPERKEEAHSLLEQAVENMGRLLGRDSERYIDNLLYLAVDMRDMGRTMAAIRTSAQALDLARAGERSEADLAEVAAIHRKLIARMPLEPDRLPEEYEDCLEFLGNVRLESTEGGSTPADDVLRGALQYRLRNLTAAFQALESSEGGELSAPYSYLQQAFLALTRQARGEPERAATHLDELRHLSGSEGFRESEWLMRLLEEVETALGR